MIDKNQVELGGWRMILVKIINKKKLVKKMKDNTNEG